MGELSVTKVDTHEEWLEERRKSIGGSDAATIVGLNKFNTPYKLYLEKKGLTSDFTGNLATETGTYLEPFVADKFSELTGKKVHVRDGVIRNTDYPWAHANVDRWLDDENAGLECKTTKAQNSKYFDEYNYPDYYYVQCLHYMGVTGADKYYLAVLIGNEDFKIYEIVRDEETQQAIDDLMEAERQFFECLVNDTPPDFNGSDIDTKAVNEKYDGCIDETVELINKDEEMRRYFELDREIKSLTSEKNKIEQELKDILGDNMHGSSNNYYIDWKPNKPRENFDHKRFIKEHPEIDVSDYIKVGKAARPFKIKEL